MIRPAVGKTEHEPTIGGDGTTVENATAELVDSHLELLHERAQIAAVLAGLPSSFGAVRQALNALQRLVGAAT
ncbi:MAG: hypothetical protein ABIR32_14050 [Ilumatobacteraceae bacterium]